MSVRSMRLWSALQYLSHFLVGQLGSLKSVLVFKVDPLEELFSRMYKKPVPPISRAEF